MLSPGIVVGFAAEARVAGRLGWPVAIGGGRSEGAAQVAQRLIEAGAQALISLGLAGGLDPALRPGALIVPSTIIADDECLATDTELSARLGGMTRLLLLGARTVAVDAGQKRLFRPRLVFVTWAGRSPT